MNIFQKIGDYIGKKIDEWADVGMALPTAYSAERDGPSITLFFAWISFLVANLSLIAVYFDEAKLTFAWTCIGFWVVATVLYMLRKLSHVKFDLDDRKIELHSGKEKTKKAPKKTRPKFEDDSNRN